jgi:type IV secretory pathway TrbL component
VKGNVISLAGTLSVLDIALAGLFWAGRRMRTSSSVW